MEVAYFVIAVIAVLYNLQYSIEDLFSSNKENSRSFKVEDILYLVSCVYVLWYFWKLLYVMVMAMVYVVMPIFNVIYNIIS